MTQPPRNIASAAVPRPVLPRWSLSRSLSSSLTRPGDGRHHSRRRRAEATGIFHRAPSPRQGQCHGLLRPLRPGQATGISNARRSCRPDPAMGASRASHREAQLGSVRPSPHSNPSFHQLLTASPSPCATSKDAVADSFLATGASRRGSPPQLPSPCQGRRRLTIRHPLVRGVAAASCAPAALTRRWAPPPPPLDRPSWSLCRRRRTCRNPPSTSRRCYARRLTPPSTSSTLPHDPPATRRVPNAAVDPLNIARAAPPPGPPSSALDDSCRIPLLRNQEVPTVQH
jgi:hypothetical protein